MTGLSSAAASGIRTRSRVEFDNSDVLIGTGPAATLDPQGPVMR